MKRKKAEEEEEEEEEEDNKTTTNGSIISSSSSSMSKNHGGVTWWRGPMIGKGSFGSVYLANLKKPNSKNGYFPPLMAVKSAEFSSSASLQKEKEVLDKFKYCRCPYIIKCYGEETTTDGYGDNLVYNVLLEYASGGTLSGVIKRHFSGSSYYGLVDDEVRYYTWCLLKGIACVHGKGYVHCDLKPGNVLLVEKGGGKGYVAKIGDFGLAKRVVLEEEERRKRSRIDFCGGTMLYMAPEVVLDQDQGQACDIWALGCVVFEMLTGKGAWGEEEEERVLERIKDRCALPVIPTEVSKEAREFLKGCLVRNPRFRLTAEMLLGLHFVSGFEGLEEEDSVEVDGAELVSKVVINSDDELGDDSLVFEDWGYDLEEEEEEPSSWVDDFVKSDVLGSEGTVSVLIAKDKSQLRPRNMVLQT